jgi:hypothetical protein
VAIEVVEGARRTAVGLGGLTAGCVGEDVVDLAILGREVAELVEALSVSELHRSTGGTFEQPLLHAHVDDS